MDTNELLIELQKQIADLQKAIGTPIPQKPISDKWLPRPQVMAYLNYGSTQMAALEKNNEIVVSKVGKRKFYHRDSIESLLERNILKLNN